MNTNETAAFALAEKLLSAFNDSPKAVMALFNENAVVEYPFAASLGRPTKLTMPLYEQYLNGVMGRIPKLDFSGVKFYPLQRPNAYWGEAHAETELPNGKLYKQDYILYFEIENEKFSYYKEYWNLLPILQATLSKEETAKLLGN